MQAPACASTGSVVLTALHPPRSLPKISPQGLGSRHTMRPCWTPSGGAHARYCRCLPWQHCAQMTSVTGACSAGSVCVATTSAPQP